MIILNKILIQTADISFLEEWNNRKKIKYDPLDSEPITPLTESHRRGGGQSGYTTFGKSAVVKRDYEKNKSIPRVLSLFVLIS